jgi:hypothetical protein
VKNITLFIVFTIALFLSACAETSATPIRGTDTPSPTVSQTLTPTLHPTPTLTKAPSATATQVLPTWNNLRNPFTGCPTVLIVAGYDTDPGSEIKPDIGFSTNDVGLWTNNGHNGYDVVTVAPLSEPPTIRSPYRWGVGEVFYLEQHTSGQGQVNWALSWSYGDFQVGVGDVVTDLIKGDKITPDSIIGTPIKWEATDFMKAYLRKQFQNIGVTFNIGKDEFWIVHVGSEAFSTGSKPNPDPNVIMNCDGD